MFEPPTLTAAFLTDLQYSSVDVLAMLDDAHYLLQTGGGQFARRPDLILPSAQWYGLMLEYSLPAYEHNDPVSIELRRWCAKASAQNRRPIKLTLPDGAIGDKHLAGNIRAWLKRSVAGPGTSPRKVTVTRTRPSKRGRWRVRIEVLLYQPRRPLVRLFDCTSSIFAPADAAAAGAGMLLHSICDELSRDLGSEVSHCALSGTQQDYVLTAILSGRDLAGRLVLGYLIGQDVPTDSSPQVGLEQHFRRLEQRLRSDAIHGKTTEVFRNTEMTNGEYEESAVVGESDERSRNTPHQTGTVKNRLSGGRAG